MKCIVLCMCSGKVLNEYFILPKFGPWVRWGEINLTGGLFEGVCGSIRSLGGRLTQFVLMT